ncbi:vWA domain-containing protein [Acanthopleuribacter pedis]|uniref:VWA domain-containing protein n=1 Tax=Acanthopleuribacter pedis TaxID=442870 RepID=A0A8J7U7S8_9BACT|nr:VWA domain-containing protein [Acanthopleuribacter pedis]MBO1323309.1 VWA domain-containing protein [Acanthopleuribacter pedis]
MRFAEPNLLYLLFLVPTLIAVFVYAERKRKAQLSHMTVNEKPGMVMGAGFERRLAYTILLSLGTLFLVLAAARPQWGTKLEEAKARGIDIIIAVDVSASMSADDVSPNRMARARQQVDKFLNLLEGDRVGLIAFAGSAFTYCPLTLDYGSVRLFLDSLEPGIITDPGTDIPSAVREAGRVFTRAKSTAQRVLVVFSDGENHEGDINAAVAEARDNGMTVFTIGIGNPGKSGSRIPIGEENGEIVYKTDRQGHIVFSQLDEAALQEIATKGGGDYYRISEAGIELSQIYKSLNLAQEAEFSSRRGQTMEDRFQYPLLIALAFLISAYSLGHRSFKKLRRTQEVHG